MIVFNYESSSGLEVGKEGSFLFETTATAGGISSKVKVKVQALWLCTGRTAHRGSRGIALLYRHCGSVQVVRPIGGVEV
jgi:hypothetical protein